jgi:tRNA A37 N6-isopentenylltransferase MiaA
MDYLTNYYKNLCEQLQEKLNLLEAGYQAALKSGNKEKMEKELARQKYLERFKEELSNKGLPIGMENFDTLDPEVQRQMKPSAATRMARVITRTGGKKGQYTTGREGHKENIEALAMQLDSEHPQEKRRIKVSELPAESPFGSDENPPMHVTPSHY